MATWNSATRNSLLGDQAKISESRRQSPVARNFDFTQDELIRRLMLTSDVYRPLTSNDLRTDSTDENEVMIEDIQSERSNIPAAETAQFNQAMALYNGGTYCKPT